MPLLASKLRHLPGKLCLFQEKKEGSQCQAIILLRSQMFPLPSKDYHVQVLHSYHNCFSGLPHFLQNVVTGHVLCPSQLHRDNNQLVSCVKRCESPVRSRRPFLQFLRKDLIFRKAHMLLFVNGVPALRILLRSRSHCGMLYRLDNLIGLDYNQIPTGGYMK